MQPVRALTDDRLSRSALATLHGPSTSAVPAEHAHRVPVVVYTAETGADGSWLYVSPQVEQILGYSAQEFLDDGTLWARILHPEDRPWVLAEEAADAEVLGTGRSSAEYRMLTKDGRLVWVLDDTTLVHDTELGLVQHGLLFDITDRKLAELRLGEHADLLERIARGETLDVVLQALAQSLLELTGAETCRVDVFQQSRQHVAGLRLVDPPASPVHRIPFGPADEPFGEITIVGPEGLPYESEQWGRRLAVLAVERSRQAESEALAYSLQLATVESTADGILVVGSGGVVVSANQKFLDMWSIPAQMAGDGCDVDIARHILSQVENADLFRSEILYLGEHTELSSSHDLTLLDERRIEAFSQPQMLNGVPLGRVWSFRDVSSLRRLEEDLRHQAHTDALTSLPNRHRFMQRLAELVPSGTDAGPVARGHALLLIDIDDFKTVNDGLGHFAGDALLVALAERVSGCVGSDGLAARLGGDEFALLVPCPQGRADVTDVLSGLVDVLDDPVTVGNRHLTIKASIGVAMSDGLATARDLFRNADLAMYTAKRDGGDASRVYTPDMHDAAIARLDLKEDLGRAIERGELDVAYQPVVSLSSGRLDGFEALARWTHPELGPISPGEFIPLAEESGMIGKLGHWVLARVCRDVAAWRDREGADQVPPVSVNLSPRQLTEPGLADQIADLIASHGLPPSAICLEVTETALGRTGVDVSETLVDIHDRGLRLSLDDFGTGHSSLARLGSYPFDVVKIDRSFVIPLTEETKHRAVVQAILQLAEAFELDVVAEGVETEDQREVLEQLGCSRVQGFLFSRPLPADRARELIAEHTALG